MTLEYFLLLLMIVSIFTGLVTEGIKKLLEESKKTYKANFLAGGVAVALSLLVGVGYIILMEAQINSKMAVYLIALVLLSWLQWLDTTRSFSHLGKLTSRIKMSS